MIPRGAESLEAFLRWLADSPKRCPKTWGGTTGKPPTSPAAALGVEGAETVLLPPKEGILFPVMVNAPLDQQQRASGEKEEDWDAAEVVEDQQKEDAP